MNYTRNFRRNFDNFCGIRGFGNSTVSDYEDCNIFLYYKSTRDIRLHVSRSTGRATDENAVGRLFFNPIPTHQTVEKAEDLLKIYTTEVQKVSLGDTIYYIRQGMIFDKDKNPILMEYMTTDGKKVLGIDYSIFKNPEEPLNRFILRKLIPYVNTGIPLTINGFSFMNLDNYFLTANPFNVTPEIIQEKLPDMIFKHFTDHGYH